jgi:hypothetical protein
LRLTVFTDPQEASENDIQAWRDSRLHANSNVQQAAQDQTASNDIDATVPVSGLLDPPAPFQTANSNNNSMAAMMISRSVPGDSSSLANAMP